nr:MAG TPA_asm: hypothetical protein [Caudoviricetes sp.]
MPSNLYLMTFYTYIIYHNIKFNKYNSYNSILYVVVLAPCEVYILRLIECSLLIKCYFLCFISTIRDKIAIISVNVS